MSYVMTPRDDTTVLVVDPSIESTVARAVGEIVGEQSASVTSEFPADVHNRATELLSRVTNDYRETNASAKHTGAVFCMHGVACCTGATHGLRSRLGSVLSNCLDSTVGCLLYTSPSPRD